MSSSIQEFFAIIIYILVLLFVGVWYAKRANENSENYFLGGRRLGPWVAAMSAEASDMSGWLLMGLPGVAYFSGSAEAFWTAIGLFIGTFCAWKIVALRLRKYSVAANNSITIPDFFSNRFDDSKKILMTIAAIITLVFFSIYVGSCFVTCGKMFATLFNLDYFTMMVVGAIIVFSYTIMGGFLAESVSDFIQGTIMFISLLVVMIGGTVYCGGFGQVAANLGGYDGFLNIFMQATPTVDANGVQQVVSGLPAFGSATPYGILTILSLLAWGLGYFGMPQVILRFMAIRKAEELKTSRRIAVTWCFISLTAAVLIGLIGRAMFPTALTTASQSELIFINIATTLLPPFAAGIIVSGILAAAMSSSDSYMLIASSAVARNIFKGLIKKDASEKTVIWVARITMALLLLFGIWIAADPNSSIFGIVSYAWAGFGACFGPLMLFSLFWRRTNLPGAIAGMVSGGITVLLWHNVIANFGGIWAIYELLPAFMVSCIFIIVVSLATKAPDKKITDVFDHYMEIEDKDVAGAVDTENSSTI